MPKGLDETAREMIDKEVTWNIGGWSESDITANQFYEKERSSIPSSSNDNPIEWSSSTDVGGKHNGIGLMYPSDYGYAVGGDVRNNCLSEILYYYEEANCYLSDWLKPSSGYVWTLSPVSTENYHAFYVDSSGYVAYDLIYDSRGVWPVAYLKSSVKIAESLPSDKEYGSIDNPFQLIDVN